MKNYTPPFNITDYMLKKVSDIMEKIGKLDNYTNLNKMPYLRKNNRINSIHSSLAIENNGLTREQVKDVINGKTVIGPQKEIQEVKNAYNAYEMIDKVNPYLIMDLKKVHSIMCYLTVEGAGEFRKGPEGVFDGDKCIFVCPPEEQVNPLMNNLFDWMECNKEKVHPLILSSIFHYEFVFIHPFSDGNGRMARLWQNIILYNFKEIFLYLPLESNIHKYQNEYYRVIHECNNMGNSSLFIEFMLKMIDETLESVINTPTIAITETAININKLLEVLESNVPKTSSEIMELLNIKSKKTFRTKYLDPAIKEGLIMLTIPDKPTSGNQMYYKQ